MGDPRRYSVSILENYSDKPLKQVALAAVKKIEDEISTENFNIEDIQNLSLGNDFLTTDEPYTWYTIAEDLTKVFSNFPDTCFCVSVSDGECGSQYRILFFNGKYVKQYPEIRYPDFLINDFEYETSGKKSLPKEVNYD